MIENRLNEHLKIETFKQIGEVADSMNLKAYLVGGFVRDLFLNRKSKDVDIVVVGSGVAFSKEVNDRLSLGKYTYFKNFGTANIKQEDGFEIEFVGARKESYQRNSRNPVVEEGSFEDDINRRDLTINAMAIALHSSEFGKLEDLFDGLADLRKGVIKTPLDPDITFSDDPLRMMRAIRFAAQLGFKIVPEALDSIQRNAKRIEIITQERITEELNKIMLSPRPSVGFEYLFDTGLLHLIFPELCALHGVEDRNGVTHKDNFYHTIKVVDNLAATSGKLWLRWAALLHDIGKAPTKRFDKRSGWTFHGHEVVGARMVGRIFKRMKLPLGDPKTYVEKLVNLHLRPIALVQDVTDSAVRRLIVDAGDDVEDLFLLCKADITSKNLRKVKRIISGFELVERKVVEVEERDKLRNWKNPISGEDVMTYFDIKPSKVIGDIKEEIKEAVLSGTIENDREQAFELMKSIGNQFGLKERT